MNLTGKYVIDKSLTLHKAYSLLCLFFANKEIARRSNPKYPDYSLSALEGMFLASEASRLLIEIAIAIRVFDDQMMNLKKNDPVRCEYEEIRNHVDKYQYGLFDDLNLTLRETCNKIIHSEVMEPHTSEGYEAHEDDLAFAHGEGDRTIDWQHLNGYVRLCGKHHNENWYVLLDVECFVLGVFKLLRGELPTKRDAKKKS